MPGDGYRGNRDIACQMPTSFAHHRRFATGWYVRFGDHAEGESNDAPYTRIPIRRPEHPQQIRAERITLPAEFAVALPVLRMAMMREMLNLVEVARVEQDEPKKTAK